MGVVARWRFIAVAFAALAIGTVRPAAATGELTEKEIAALEAGRPVVREENVERGGRRYIGGVGYVLIDATPAEVHRTLDDVNAYRHILPSTRSVRWVGLSRTGDAIVELEQGNSIAHGKYTVRIRRESAVTDSSAATVRFWLDRRYAHDVADANGFFHLEARGDKTLLTYLVMVDLGSGLAARLFEGRIRRAALTTPALVKNYVESHRPALD